MVELDPALKDLVGYLKDNYRVGDKIPGERDLAAFIIGYSRQKIRESLIRLACFGYVEISHGKTSVFTKDFN